MNVEELKKSVTAEMDEMLANVAATKGENWAKAVRYTVSCATIDMVAQPHVSDPLSAMLLLEAIGKLNLMLLEDLGITDRAQQQEVADMARSMHDTIRRRCQEAKSKH